MNSHNFASGEDLFKAKNRNQVLPSWGAKESEVSGSWFEERQVETRLQDRQDLISEIRLARKDQLAFGSWIGESKMVLLVQQAGAFWEYMGVETDIGRCLYPEEALYLIEMGELEVNQGDLPLSIQSAQAVMLHNHYLVDQYLVYAHLARAGCKVVRHQPHLKFTKYEKQIRLDQYQAKKKKRKLKLKENSLKSKETKESDVVTVTQNVSTYDADSRHKVAEPKSQILDAAIQDFYSFLGEAPSGPPEEDETQPEIEEVFRSVALDTRSKMKESSTELPVTQLNKYERKKSKYLDMFPSMLGTEDQGVQAEESDLCPENSKPQKKRYRVALKILKYYSKYFEDESQDFQNNWQNSRGRGREGFFGRQGNNGNRSRGFSNRGNFSDFGHRHMGDRNREGYNRGGLSTNDVNVVKVNYQKAFVDEKFDHRQAYQARVEAFVGDMRKDGNGGGSEPRRGNEDSHDRRYVEGNHPSMKRQNDSNWRDETKQERKKARFDVDVDRMGRYSKEQFCNNQRRGENTGEERWAADVKYNQRDRNYREGRTDFDQSHFGRDSQQGTYRSEEGFKDGKTGFDERRMDRCGTPHLQNQQTGDCSNVGDRWSSGREFAGQRPREDYMERRLVEERWNEGRNNNREGRTTEGRWSDNRPEFVKRGKPDWLQHDDRWSAPESPDQGMTPSVSEEPSLDLSVAPAWKTKRRKRPRKERLDYPSHLVQVPFQISSWKEYKNYASTLTVDKVLAEGVGRSLWNNGSTVPLIKPDQSTTLHSVLDKCQLGFDVSQTNLNPQALKFPLPLHFDVYLPNKTYKKSNPSIPGKRITVIRDGSMPSLEEIEEVTKRFEDGTHVVCALVVSGEVRLYTLSPVVIPSPKQTL